MKKNYSLVGIFCLSMLMSCASQNTSNNSNQEVSSQEVTEQNQEANQEVVNKNSNQKCPIDVKNFDFNQLFGTRWHNGQEFFKVCRDGDELLNGNIESEEKNPKNLHFFGGSYHDAGAYFLLEHKSGKSFVDQDGQTIVIKDYNGTIWFERKDLFYTLDLGERINYIEKGSALLLSGEYEDQNGESFVFTEDFKLNGKDYWFSYDDFDFPDKFIKIDDKVVYYYQFSKEGIELYSVKTVYNDVMEQDEYVKDKLIYKLKKLAFSNKNKEFFPYTSSQILNIEELSEMPKEMLRIMRNEIYARHNREFKSKDLADLFSGRKGYTPNPNFKESELNPIEIINVGLISKAEK